MATRLLTAAIPGLAQCALCEAECARVRILGGRAVYMTRRADDMQRVVEGFNVASDLLQAVSTSIASEAQA